MLAYRLAVLIAKGRSGIVPIPLVLENLTYQQVIFTFIRVDDGEQHLHKGVAVPELSDQHLPVRRETKSEWGATSPPSIVNAK